MAERALANASQSEMEISVLSRGKRAQESHLPKRQEREELRRPKTNKTRVTRLGKQQFGRDWAGEGAF